MVLMWRAFPYQITFTLKSLKRLSQSPGLLSACHAVFMHWHVEWETSLRTPSHSSAKYTQLETVWVTDIKAIMFLQTVPWWPVLCRVFLLSVESKGDGDGRQSESETRCDKEWESNTENKTRAEMEKQKGVSGSFLSVTASVLEAVRLILIAVNEKSSTCMEDKPHCSHSTWVVFTSPDIPS